MPCTWPTRSRQRIPKIPHASSRNPVVYASIRCPKEILKILHASSRNPIVYASNIGRNLESTVRFLEIWTNEN